LYAAANFRRFAFAVTSTSFEIPVGTGITFAELMSNPFLALLITLQGGECLTHVDTELPAALKYSCYFDVLEMSLPLRFHARRSRGRL